MAAIPPLQITCTASLGVLLFLSCVSAFEGSFDKPLPAIKKSIIGNASNQPPASKIITPVISAANEAEAVNNLLHQAKAQNKTVAKTAKNKYK